LDPALHGSNDAIGVSGPDEGLGIGIGFREEAVDELGVRRSSGIRPASATAG